MDHIRYSVRSITVVARSKAWTVFARLNTGIVGSSPTRAEACVCVFFIASGLELSPLYCGHFWPIVPAPDDRWGWLWSNWWNEDWQGKPKYSEKTCPSATLSTRNPTWPDLGSNPDRRGWKPATNRLSYCAAPCVRLFFVCFVLAVDSGLARADHPSMESYRLCID
jgi:hypothetical protein